MNPDFCLSQVSSALRQAFLPVAYEHVQVIDLSHLRIWHRIFSDHPQLGVHVRREYCSWYSEESTRPELLHEDETDEHLIPSGTDIEFDPEYEYFEPEIPTPEEAHQRFGSLSDKLRNLEVFEWFCNVMSEFTQFLQLDPTCLRSAHDGP